MTNPRFPTSLNNQSTDIESGDDNKQDLVRSTRERGCSRAKVFRDAGGSDLIMRTISLGCGCRPLSVLRGWGRHLLSSSARPNQCRLQDSFLKPSSSPRASQISSPSYQHPVRFCICSALCSRPFCRVFCLPRLSYFLPQTNQEKYCFERI